MSNRIKNAKKQAKIVNLNAKIYNLHQELKEALSSDDNELVNNISKELNSQKQRLKSLYDSQKIIVSDHALIRYMERVLGMDLKKIEQQIIKFAEQNKHPLFDIKVVDNIITTIIAKDD